MQTDKQKHPYKPTARNLEALAKNTRDLFQTLYQFHEIFEFVNTSTHSFIHSLPVSMKTKEALIKGGIRMGGAEGIKAIINYDDSDLDSIPGLRGSGAEELRPVLDYLKRNIDLDNIPIWQQELKATARGN